MQTQLYPAEYAEDSLERLFAERSRKSHAVYLLVLFALVGGLALLPFARVDVSVQSAGIIRPATEKHEVKARASGLVQELLVRENQGVAAGQPLMVLRAAATQEQGRMLAAQAGERRGAVADLEAMVRAAGAGAAPAAFATPRYRQAWAQYRNDAREAALKQERAAREAERARALGTRGLAPQSEVDDREFQLAQARSEAGLLRERYLSGWQAELAQARTDLRDLLGRQGRLAEDLELYRIASPVTGTVEQLQGVSPGSFVTAGEPIAVISPRSALQAEVWVTPRDIGLVHPGAPVRLQVDAFNYNDWGMVPGRVREVSDDYVEVGGQPVFKVRCSLDRDYLALANGFRGRLKKGMTLQARFVVARRTLLQLLYENVNDWLDPAAPPRARAGAR
jgi:multidrug resistance efflux pump